MQDTLSGASLVICFDRGVSQVRMFNINRIRYVEILESEPWKFTASHKIMEVDIFHMTGPKPIHVFNISLKKSFYATTEIGTLLCPKR